MPFGFITIGLIMVITGVKGTHAALGAQLQKDFTGDRNFIYWLLAIGVVGSIGYVENEKAKTFSHLFLVLIIVAMVLKNGGFAQKLMEALQQGPVKIAAPITATSSAPAAASSSSSASSSNPLASVASAVGSIAKIAAIFA